MREIHPMRVYLLCTATPLSAVETEHVCRARQSLQTLHRALLLVSAFRSVVLCLKWVFHDRVAHICQLTINNTVSTAAVIFVPRMLVCPKPSRYCIATLVYTRLEMFTLNCVEYAYNICVSVACIDCRLTFIAGIPTLAAKFCGVLPHY